MRPKAKPLRLHRGLAHVRALPSLPMLDHRLPQLPPITDGLCNAATFRRKMASRRKKPAA